LNRDYFDVGSDIVKAAEVQHFLSIVGLCWKLNLCGGFMQSVGITQRTANSVMIRRWQQYEQDL
jgi:hypothetical protein